MNKKAKQNPDKAKMVISVCKNYNEKRTYRYYYDVTLTVGETIKNDGGYASWRWQAILFAKQAAKQLLRGKRKEIYHKEIDVKVQ